MNDGREDPFTRREFVATASLAVSTLVLQQTSEASYVKSESQSLVQPGEKMDIPIRIAAAEAFEARLLNSSEKGSSLGWAWIQGNVGTAKIEVEDGNKHPFGEQVVRAGVCAIEIFSNANRPIVIRITAREEGFSGLVCFELASRS